jgi:DNA-binding FadR family transcriptional regulator
VATRASRRRSAAASRRGAYEQAAREVADLLDHRRVLEAGIAFAAAQRATPAAGRRLRRLVEVMDEATSWAEMGVVDPRFHLEVADIAGSVGAKQALTAVLARVMRFYLPPGDSDEWRTFNDDHRDLVAAIAAGRADEAGRIAEWHVRRVAGVVSE